MKLTIGNTRIEFRTDYCSEENQQELERQYLQQISRNASLALASSHNKAS